MPKWGLFPNEATVKSLQHQACAGCKKQMGCLSQYFADENLFFVFFKSKTLFLLCVRDKFLL